MSEAKVIKMRHITLEDVLKWIRERASDTDLRSAALCITAEGFRRSGEDPAVMDEFFEMANMPQKDIEQFKKFAAE